MVIHKPLQTHPPKCEVKSLLSIADPPVLEQDPIFAITQRRTRCGCLRWQVCALCRARDFQHLCDDNSWGKPADMWEFAAVRVCWHDNGKIHPWVQWLSVVWPFRIDVKNVGENRCPTGHLAWLGTAAFKQCGSATLAFPSSVEP
jgi:hypothetical protein